VFNVATGGRISLNQVFGVVQRLAGTHITPMYGPERAGDVRHSQADISRARAVLHYEPTVSLEDGLAQTIAWFKSDPAT
jgi:nucleoside-diphosphate-sugar epimerase